MLNIIEVAILYCNCERHTYSDCSKIKRQVDSEVSVISKCPRSDFINYSIIDQWDPNDLFKKNETILFEAKKKVLGLEH